VRSARARLRVSGFPKRNGVHGDAGVFVRRAGARVPRAVAGAAREDGGGEHQREPRDGPGHARYQSTLPEVSKPAPGDAASRNLDAGNGVNTFHFSTCPLLCGPRATGPGAAGAPMCQVKGPDPYSTDSTEFGRTRDCCGVRSLDLRPLPVCPTQHKRLCLVQR
jgi:hypothetical protein